MTKYCLVLALLAGTDQPPHGQEWPQKLQWVERIKPGGVVVIREYRESATKEVEIPDLIFWQAVLDKSDPLDTIYWGEEVDWKNKLVSKGLARLQEASSYSQDLHAAENQAQTQKAGLWVQEASEPQAGEESRESKFSITWDKVKEWILFYGGLGAVIAAVIAIIRLFLRLLRRKLVYLIFLGPQATGKTWLWKRITNPDVSKEELANIKQSSKKDVAKMSQPEPMGRYEVTPIYITVPGGRPGEHLMELLTKRRLQPSKHVWVITLSTTPDSRIRKGSPEEQKIDLRYISEQLGYLSLPLGVLAAKRTPKPSMVLVAISKFDLFADREPGRPESKAAEEALLKLFQPHIKRVQEECTAKNVKFKTEFCSAWEGWKTESLARHIKQALFAA